MHMQSRLQLFQHRILIIDKKLRELYKISKENTEPILKCCNVQKIVNETMQLVSYITIEEHGTTN